MRPRVLISMCLLGVNCRYDGAGKPLPDLEKLMARCELIPICPEQLGGMTTPRMPSERRGGKVVSKDGRDVTDHFVTGAEQSCLLAEKFGARYALLKARSPSCGTGEIYDGSFSGVRVPGYGVAAERLRDMGLQLYDEHHIDDLIKALEGETI